MSEHKLESLYHQLDSPDAQTRLAAAQRLAELGQTGAAVLARALVDYPWLNAWKGRLRALRNEKYPRLGGFSVQLALPEGFHNTYRLPPFCAAPPLHVIQGLVFLKQDAFPDILRLLEHKRVEVRLAALVILRFRLCNWQEIELDVTPCVPALCHRLRDEGPAVRIGACLALAMIEEHAAPALPILAERYRLTPDPHERQVIVQVLIKLRCSADVMTEIVAEFISGSDRKTQAEVFHTFFFMHSLEYAAPLVPLMLDFIRARMAARDNASDNDSEMVAGYLGKVGPEAAQAILELEHDPDERLHRLAFRAITEFPPHLDGRPLAGMLLDRLARNYSKDLVNLLMRIREKHGLYPEDEARWTELQRSRVETVSSAVFLDELVRDLQSSDREIACRAYQKVRALPESRIEPIASRLLQIMLTSKDMDHACKEILKKYAYRLPGLAPGLVAPLEQMIATGHDPKYRYLVEVLLAMGPLAVLLMPQVARMIDAGLCGLGLALLRNIGPAALEHMPGLVTTLTGWLNEPDQDLRLNAILTLGAMGAAARPAAPQLLAIAQSNSVKLASAGREALTRIAYADHMSAT